MWKFYFGSISFLRRRRKNNFRLLHLIKFCSWVDFYLRISKIWFKFLRSLYRNLRWYLSKKKLKILLNFRQVDHSGATMKGHLKCQMAAQMILAIWEVLVVINEIFIHNISGVFSLSYFFLLRLLWQTTSIGLTVMFLRFKLPYFSVC